MVISVRDGASFKTGKSLSVRDGGTWKGAKQAWVRKADGTWAAFLGTTVSLSASATSVTEQSYVNMVPAYSNPNVVSSVEWYHKSPGATSFTKDTYTGATNNWRAHTPGTWQWYMVAITAGGQRITSNTVTITVLYVRSTANCTGPSWTFNTASSMNSSANTRITVTLSNPASLAKVEWQAILPGVNPDWVTYETVSPVGSGQTSMWWDRTWGTPGSGWKHRAKLTHKDGAIVYSNEASINVIQRKLTAAASPTSPPMGTTTTLTASSNSNVGSASAYMTKGEWLFQEIGETAYKSWGHTHNPCAHWSSNRDLGWRWFEYYNNGQSLTSNYVRVNPVASEATALSGGTTWTVQDCLDRAYNSTHKKARLAGTFTGSGQVRIPAGITIDANAATFNNIQFMNADTTNRGSSTNRGGGYTRAGWFKWYGGKIDAWNSKSTAFSISHSPGFHIEGVEIWNTKETGHGIEINSSGGPASSKPINGSNAMTDADFNIKIINCKFRGMDVTPRTSGYDEAIHFDYSWIKDGSPATVAGVANDGTVCHNILIRGCYFDNARRYSYPTSIGNHKFTMNPSGGETVPREIHSHLKIQDCTFRCTGMSANTTSQRERGSGVHLIAFRQVMIIDNYFDGTYRGYAFESRSYLPQTQENIHVFRNTFRSNGHNFGGHSSRNATSWYSAPWVDTDINDNKGGRIYGVYISYNKFHGWVSAAQATWLIRCNDVDVLRVHDNYFYGLQGNGSYTGQTGNRIHGSEKSPSSTVTQYQCYNNRWANNEAGTGSVISNS